MRRWPDHRVATALKRKLFVVSVGMGMAAAVPVVCVGLSMLVAGIYHGLSRQPGPSDGILFSAFSLGLLISLPLTMLVLIATFLRVLLPDRPGPDHCRRCGYNLRGSGGRPCPECGQPQQP